MARGSVLPRNGRWRAQVYLGRDKNGKPDYQNKTFDKESDGWKYVRQVLSDFEKGKHVKPSKQKLNTYIELWLKHKKPTIKGQTWDRYESLCRNHIIPYLGKYDLDKLKPITIQTMYTELLNKGRCNGKGGLSARTVSDIHTCLTTALNQAVQWQMLQRNPVVNVEKPKIKKPQIEILKKEELRHLLTYLEIFSSKYFLPAFICSCTGMRIAEVLALTWSDISIENNTISIFNAMEVTTSNGIKIVNVKTACSRRNIIIPKSAMDKIVEYKKGNIVCGDENGNYINRRTITKSFTNLCVKSGLGSYGIHALRHTHVAHLIELGVPIKVIQERLGHSSIRITLDTYGHLMPGMQEAASKALEAFYDENEAL